MMTSKIKNVFESVSLATLILVSLVFDYIAKRKTFSYPDYKIVVASPFALTDWFWTLIIALIISLLAIIIIKASARKKIMPAILTSLSGVILVIAHCYIKNFDCQMYTYTFQRIVISSYMLICYAITSLLKYKMPKKYAGIVYTAINIAMIFFCSWNVFYKRFYYNPAVIICLSTGFTIVYLKMFYDQFISILQKAIIFSGSIVIHLFAFSFYRIAQIFNNINLWSFYHKNILNAFCRHDYLNLNLEPPALYALRDILMMWLGLAFSTTYQIIYILVFVLFLIYLIWLYMKHKDNFIKFLIVSILLSNLCALFCNINMFYSLELGIMTAGNLFQLIPLICLLFMLMKGEI